MVQLCPLCMKRNAATGPATPPPIIRMSNILEDVELFYKEKKKKEEDREEEGEEQKQLSS